jgi:glycosyltransferase involved in cell wall biosynthesis
MHKGTYISAVILTYNEQDHIARCVQSLQDVADQVIVLDSNSTDNTVAICNDLGVKVVNTIWKGYAKTKNLGNKEAKYDTILSIDADEALSNELIASILVQKGIGFNESDVYKFHRLNNYCGQWIRYAGWYPDTKVRIFNRLNTRWEGDVHEYLVHTTPVSEKLLSGDMLHYSIKDKADHIARIKKYNLLARKYPNRLIAFLSAISTFVKLYIIKRGFLDGKLGYQLCIISAKAKIWR